MSEIRLNFLNWRPDLEPSGHDGLTEADNVYHDAEGYKQVTKNDDSAASVLSTVQLSTVSVTSVQLRQIGPNMVPEEDNNRMLARLTNATTASLYVNHIIEFSGHELEATLTAAAGTAHAMATAGAIVSFQACELGDYVFFAARAEGEAASGTALSANVTGTMEIETVNAGNGEERSGDYFTEALAASTVSAMTCATVGEFVVIAPEDDMTSVRWCAIGDPNNWPTPNTDAARAVQAGSQSMPPALGNVTAIAPGDFFGYVFQERGITKMTYVGGDVVFAFDLLEQGRGCRGYNRLVTADGTIYFESEAGYHALRDGQIVDIGYGRVNDTHTPAVDANGEQQNVVSNEAINCVIFENQTLCYNYKTDQWTRLPAFDGYALYSIYDKDAIIGTVVLTHALQDSYSLQGHAGGTAQTATLETAETDLNQGGRAQVDGVRPRVNGGTVAVSVGIRNDLDDAVTYSTGTAINSRTGMSNFRDATNNAEGRYQRVKLTITGGFETALGADVEFYETGDV